MPSPSNHHNYVRFDGNLQLFITAMIEIDEGLSGIVGDGEHLIFDSAEDEAAAMEIIKLPTMMPVLILQTTTI